MIEEIKKRVKKHREIQYEIPYSEYYQFASDVEYLLEHNETMLDKFEKEIKFQVERNDKQRAIYFEQEAIVLKHNAVLEQNKALVEALEQIKSRTVHLSQDHGINNIALAALTTYKGEK